MKGEGTRLGTVRFLPRGVKKQEYAERNFFDLWLPELAPSRGLVKWAFSAPLTDARWAAYARRYRREMNRPEVRRLLAVLAALGARTNLSVGCYCENPERCHRSLLAELLREHGAKVVIPRSASPPRSR